MKCLFTDRIAGPCAGCGEFQQHGVHLIEEDSDRRAIYCAECCPVHAVVGASELEGLFA